MRKYILLAGSCLVVCGFSRSPQTNNNADAALRLSENSLAGFVAVDKDKFNFSLSAEDNELDDDVENISYSATLKRHRLHGQWQSWYNNDKLCDSGKFARGLPDGEWKHWDINGQLLSVRNYDADKLLRIKNDISRNHPKLISYPLASLYSKNRKRARQYMEAGYSFSFKGSSFQSLSLQQLVENNITPGNSYRPVFNECLHHGLYMNFFSNGIAKDSGYYKDGLRDGIWMHRNTADNSYMLGLYKNGIKTGEWKQYNSSDRLITFIFYNKKGEEEWRKKTRE